MADWRLRRATVDDAPAAALVAGATFLQAFAGIMSGADIVAHVGRKCSVETFAAWAATPDTVVTLAEHPEGAPLGYTVLVSPDLPIPTSRADIELRRIYTLSHLHGTGLGPALMARAVEDARGMTKRRLLLGVFARNHRARAFYEKQGFMVAGERKFLVGSSWFDDAIYAREL